MTELLRRTWLWPDHYYWQTSMLAAQGTQRAVCRIVAVVTLAFGATPVALMTSPRGTAGLRNDLIAAGIGVVCLVIALSWLRSRWPTGRESRTYVVISSLCIALASLIQSEPLAGMLGCTVFAVLAAYIAFFHSGRLLIFNTTVALITSGVIAWRLSTDGDPMLAATAMTIIATVYVLLPLAYHDLVRMLGVAVPNSDIDPLTGLLNRDAFYRATGELFAVRGRMDDHHLVIAAVSLDNLGLLMQTKGQAAGDRATVAIAQALRETTRGDAILARTGDGEFLITDTFSSTDASPLIERVRASIATTPPRLTASIGVVSAPIRVLAGLPPEEVIDELIESAHTQRLEARSAGGNQSRSVVCTAPRALDGGVDPEDPA